MENGVLTFLNMSLLQKEPKRDIYMFSSGLGCSQFTKASNFQIYLQWLKELINWKTNSSSHNFQKQLCYLLTNSLSQPFPPNLQNIINTKRQSQRPEIMRQCLPLPDCNMSHVTCHISHVTSQIFFCGGGVTQWCSQLLEGLLSTGPIPSSFTTKNI